MTTSANPKKRPKRALILSGGGARGAYQVGVWKYLLEKNWRPDLICGTSVGAVNASGIGSGLDLIELIKVWKTIERRVFRLSVWRQIKHFFRRGDFAPITDTDPLRDLLTELIDVPTLRNSDMEIVIAAVNLMQNRLKFYNNQVIDVEHIMASSAIPILFPWRYAEGDPHWDGGIMANTPILPALERGAREIIICLLSPVGGSQLELPATTSEAVERVFELAQIGSYESFMSHLAWERKVRRNIGPLGGVVRRTLAMDDIKISTVAPGRMLGFYSMLNFSKKQADTLITEGYRDAKNQLAGHFGESEEPY